MQNPKPSVEAQYKTLVIVWAALLMSQLGFFVLVFAARPGLFRFDFAQPLAGPSVAMTGGFAVAAVTTVLLSFAFRRRLNERAVAEQKTDHVQSALIIAVALCEASSLFGLALAVAFEYQYFFLWILLGVAATLLHFPKREELHAASHRN